MELAELVAVINRQHGTAFALTGMLPGGTRGAYGVASPDGTRAVLKRATRPQRPDQLRRVVALTQRLRAIGYPAPVYLLVGSASDGTSYYVQELLPGEPVELLTPDILDQILTLNDLQAGQAVAVSQAAAQDLATTQNWSRYVHEVVFSGESGWAATLRSHSPATAALLGQVEEFSQPYEAAILPADDIVHGDFGANNVLAHDDVVTGVIDLEAAGCGTRAIDLAVLLGWSYEETAPTQRRRLLERIVQIAGSAGLTTCAAYQVLNMVHYAVHHHGKQGVVRRVASSSRLVNEAKAVLDTAA